MNRSPRRAKSPTYTDCSNDTDIITLDEFDEKSDIIYIYQGDNIKCYNYETLIRFLNIPDSTMAEWINGDEMGYGGSPNLNYLVHKMPDGFIWITHESLLILSESDYKYYNLKLVYENVPIGNIQGISCSSQKS